MRYGWRGSVCLINDKRLGKAASEIEGVKVFADVKSLHAELKPELDKFGAMVAFLRKDETALAKEIQDRLEIEFDGMEITHPAIPEDNNTAFINGSYEICLLYTSPSPRDRQKSRMPSSA